MRHATIGTYRMNVQDECIYNDYDDHQMYMDVIQNFKLYHMNVRGSLLPFY